MTKDYDLLSTNHSLGLTAAFAFILFVILFGLAFFVCYLKANFFGGLQS